MVIFYKQILVALLFGVFYVNCVDAAEPKDYQKIVEPGFAHLTCAAYGVLAANEKNKKSSQRSFSRGSLLLAEWLNDMTSGKAPIGSVEFAPKRIRLVPIPIPGLNFHMGYIWAQVEMDARIQVASGYLEAIDGKDFEGTLPTLRNLEFNVGEEGSRFRAEAEIKFKKSNCEVLR